MSRKVKKDETITVINYSEVYSKSEVAQFFDCLPAETQDELLSIMRKMVAENKTKEAV